MSKIQLTMFYNGVKIPEEQFQDRGVGLFSLVFKDTRGKSADSLDLQFNDEQGKWKNEFIPQKTDKISFEIRTARHVLSTPPFYVDGIDWDDPNSTVRVKGLNYIYNKGKSIKKKRTLMYGDTTLRNVVGAIAQRNGWKLLWFGNDTPLTRLKQARTSDYSFLRKLAGETGSFFKIMKKQLIWGSEADGYTFKRDGGEVTTTEEGAGQRYIEIDPAELEKLHFSLKSNKKSGVTFEPLSIINKKLDRILGKRSEDYELGPIVTTDLVTSADIAAQGVMSKLIHGDLTCDFTINVTDSMGPLAQELLAGSLVYIPDVEKLSGTYVIEDATHTVATTKGWKIECKCSRINSKQLTKPKRKRKPKERSLDKKNQSSEKEKKPVSKVTAGQGAPDAVTGAQKRTVAATSYKLAPGGDDYNDNGSEKYEMDDIGTQSTEDFTPI